MGDPHRVTSIEGFVQLLACNLLPHGYWFYVTGRIPEAKDPLRIDSKLVKKYQADLSRPARARRKQSGQANVRYLRHGRFFVVLATHGIHSFFDEEQASVRDIRRVPLRLGGYSVSYRRGGRKPDGSVDRGWHSHVEIDRRHFRELRAYFSEMATRWSAARLGLEFYRLPFEPYAPVRRQLLTLLKVVNQRRKRAGLSQLPHEVLPMRRRVVRPFEESGQASRTRVHRRNAGRR